MTDHLSDGNTYKYLTPAQAQMYKSKIMKLICKWILKYKKDITEMERKFLLISLEDNKDPFPAFTFWPKCIRHLGKHTQLLVVLAAYSTR
jgi:hypothetical protein